MQLRPDQAGRRLMRPERIILAVACLMLAACSRVSGVREERTQQVAVPSSETIQATQLASHLYALQTVVQGSPAEQAEVMAAARQAYEQAHQGPAALRYGLLLAAPSHPARDPALAQRLLREALARPELLSLIERALAVVDLERIDTELRLVTENERLVADVQRELERQRNVPVNTTALNRRLQAAEEDNARLRKALDEARAKLDAIANIERNIPLPSPSTDGRKP